MEKGRLGIHILGVMGERERKERESSIFSTVFVFMKGNFDICSIPTNLQNLHRNGRK